MQRGLSARAASMPCQVQTQRWISHCPDSGVPNLLEGDSRPLPQGILTQKAAQCATLQAQPDGRGHPRHPVFP